MSDDYDMDDLRRTWCLADKLILPQGPTVLVVGAYKGKVIDFLLSDPRYEGLWHNSLGYIGQIVGYEPQLWACEAASKHLNEVHSAKPWELWPYGLVTPEDAITDGITLEMRGFETDTATITPSTGDSNLDRQVGNGNFHSVGWDLYDEDLGFDHVDLMIMNIEGYEWRLLPWLLEYDPDPRGQALTETDMIDSFAVQFHEHATEPAKQQEVLTLMDEYYERVYDQYPSWVYWRKRGLA